MAAAQWRPGLPAGAYPAGAPISSRRNGGKEGPGGLRPPWTPQYEGSWRRRAVQTGQRPGEHCRPFYWQSCYRRCRASVARIGITLQAMRAVALYPAARRAAVGAMPLKYCGACGGLETARQGCRALHRRPKLRIVRFRASPKAHSLRWASAGAPIPATSRVFQLHGTDGGPAGQAGTAQLPTRLAG